jgi:dGTPase
MSEEFVDMLENRGESLEDVVCDYISGMTDQYAIQKFQEYFVPKSWS